MAQNFVFYGMIWQTLVIMQNLCSVCWSMILTDYNLTFIYITGSNNILVDVISRLKTLDIYKDPLYYPKISNTTACVA